MQELSPLALEAQLYKIPAALVAAGRIHNSFNRIEEGRAAELETAEAWSEALHIIEKWVMTEPRLHSHERSAFKEAVRNLCARLHHDQQDNPAPAVAWMKNMRDDAQLADDIIKLQELCDIIPIILRNKSKEQRAA